MAHMELNSLKIKECSLFESFEVKMMMNIVHNFNIHYAAVVYCIMFTIMTHKLVCLV